jgi:hypothetical protein
VANDEARHETAPVDVQLPEAESGNTPALSSNYLRVRLRGNWPPNQWINVRVCAVWENDLIGEPEQSISSESSVAAFA